MLSVEKISNKIAIKLAKDTNGNDQKRQVIQYGVFAIIQIAISIGLVIIFGLIFNVLVPALIMSFTISILRKYSGGVHASTPGICSFIGTIICIIVPIILKYINLKFTAVLIIGIILFIISYYLIYKLAPRDSEKKRIKKEEKRKRLKRKSIYILTIYLLITVILLLIYSNFNRQYILVYIISIYAGICWQVFSITKLGYIVLGKIDFLLNKLFSLGGI